MRRSCATTKTYLDLLVLFGRLGEELGKEALALRLGPLGLLISSHLCLLHLMATHLGLLLLRFLPDLGSLGSLGSRNLGRGAVNGSSSLGGSVQVALLSVGGGGRLVGLCKLAYARLGPSFSYAMNENQLTGSTTATAAIVSVTTTGSSGLPASTVTSSATTTGAGMPSLGATAGAACCSVAAVSS